MARERITLRLHKELIEWLGQDAERTHDGNRNRHIETILEKYRETRGRESELKEDK